MRALHITLQMLENKVQNLFNGIKPSGYAENKRNFKSSDGCGRKWELLARATDSSTMDAIGKIRFEITSMFFITALYLTEWLLVTDTLICGICLANLT